MDHIGSAIIDFTEAAYDLDASDERWLPEMLARGLPALEHGLGVAGYWYGRPPDNDEVELLDVHVASGPEDFAERHLRALATTDPALLRTQLRPGSATTGSDFARDDPGQLAHYVSHVDYCKDVLFITAVDTRGSGVAVVAPLAEVTTLSGPEQQRWEMLAAHVDAGHRLRHGVPSKDGDEGGTTGLPHDAEAVLDPTTFRVSEAAGRAKERSTAGKLRDAAIRVDRARGELRREDPDSALELWKALVGGRWSLVDWFDTDDRRYVLAVPNAPHITDPRGLTERESQVVTYAAAGHTNKMIAYRLGLSRSRVSTVLRTAMRKLGFRTRAQLVKGVRDFTMLS